MNVYPDRGFPIPRLLRFIKIDIITPPSSPLPRVCVLVNEGMDEVLYLQVPLERMYGVLQSNFHSDHGLALNTFLTINNFYGELFFFLLHQSHYANNVFIA